VLVCPGDLPALTANDVDVCIAAFRRHSDRIVVAVRAGRRGHPIIFPAKLIPFVESSACDHGLNALPRALPKRVLEVECPSDGILHDVDTPADLDPSRPAE
jgi:molybdenum cofactor cytidylyltransferase